MSDERVRALLREIERELEGTGRTLADVIRERLRITPEDETARVRDLIGGRLVANEPIVSQSLVRILHGASTEAALVVAVQSLAGTLLATRDMLVDERMRAPMAYASLRAGQPIRFAPAEAPDGVALFRAAEAFPPSFAEVPEPPSPSWERGG